MFECVAVIDVVNVSIHIFFASILNFSRSINSSGAGVVHILSYQRISNKSTY